MTPLDEILKDMERLNTGLCENEDIPRLIAALKRVMAEVKHSTDKAFYEHCEQKAAAILRGDSHWGEE